MTDRRLLRVDRAARKYSVFHWDESDEIFHIETRQDVQPILDHNKALLNSGEDGYSPSRELQRVASIPSVVVLQWLKEGIDVGNPDHWPAVERKLNDPDWRHLRTAPGRV